MFFIIILVVVVLLVVWVQLRDRLARLEWQVKELTARVEEGKKAGKPLAELQKTLTMASIKTLQTDGYGSYVADNLKNFTVYLGQRTAVEDRLSANIEAIYKNLDRA